MPRALVVEDEVHIRDLIALHLGLNGLEVDAVGDGRAGLARSRERGYDLVVLDIMLPGLDGLSVCRAIRHEGRNADVPILMPRQRYNASPASAPHCPNRPYVRPKWI